MRSEGGRETYAEDSVEEVADSSFVVRDGGVTASEEVSEGFGSA